MVISFSQVYKWCLLISGMRGIRYRMFSVCVAVMFVSIKIMLWLLAFTYMFKVSGSNPQWEIVAVNPRQLHES